MPSFRLPPRLAPPLQGADRARFPIGMERAGQPAYLVAAARIERATARL